VATARPQSGPAEKEFLIIDFRRFDLGLTLGAGVSYPLGPGRMMFDLRTTMGLLSIHKESDHPYTNFALMFLFSYVFGGRQAPGAEPRIIERELADPR